MYYPGRVLLESIKDVIRSDDFTEKKCPSNCKSHGKCNVITGECMCRDRWIGPDCGRKIGDLSIPKQKGGWYKPDKGITWQWQLQGEIDRTYDVDLYDIDFDTSPQVIKELHKDGRKVMCYFSAGSWEMWRKDADMYPASVKGGILSFASGDTFSNEAWLDLRRMDVIGPLMLERLDVAQQKGCDAIEFDNADTVTHTAKLGGDIELRTQLRVNKWLVAQAHVRGMGVALKNSEMFATFLSDTYDMVVNEECFVMGNCDNYWPFLNREKPVLNCEYTTALCFYCKRAKAMEFSTIKKTPALDACMVDCSHDYSESVCKATGYTDATGKQWKHAKYDGKKNKDGWCPMAQNKQKDESPAKRYGTCDPERGY
ncbi:hypothetical protein SARC_10117 [Sphaeroforma arctica JP610]|uniref:EGF-like domain-containing protein n=1 Tax=Sphaeroforma arctica JP610 TaxID=667725 RepID=A0A0L0FN09_9EUKA|nr:hypothetical protein SARC_10117 [Sphaeroforma arctica JP610]KNC77423.1 hypothetical protein SARC_10117 [Sphaeroforma arctica JP610]|eukprot:XP_014151325.1 hypothetical protein SARC_10117 [Sphaeroforma arctica JP610]